jgi:multiple sugar transport system ATP-binding protein
MTVYDNLAFPLRMRKGDKATIRQRVDRVAGVLEIRDLLKRKPATLSGGQRQRVALGRAVVRQPAAFLFDEPLAHLDVRSRSALRAQIKALHARFGLTALYVTHEQSEAMALGGRIAVLRAGRLQQVGLPDAVYGDPANRFVAGFFGSPPMNFFDARVRRDKGEVCVEIGDVPLWLPPRLHECVVGSKVGTVVVGVRPHDLSLEREAHSSRSVLVGRVATVEPLGSRTDVHLDLAVGARCTVSTPPSAAAVVGDEVHVAVDTERLHLFEAGPEGRSLSSRVTAGNLAAGNHPGCPWPPACSPE